MPRHAELGFGDDVFAGVVAQLDAEFSDGAPEFDLDVEAVEDSASQLLGMPLPPQDVPAFVALVEGIGAQLVEHYYIASEPSTVEEELEWAAGQHAAGDAERVYPEMEALWRSVGEPHGLGWFAQACAERDALAGEADAVDEVGSLAELVAELGGDGEALATVAELEQVLRRHLRGSGMKVVRGDALKLDVGPGRARLTVNGPDDIRVEVHRGDGQPPVATRSTLEEMQSRAGAQLCALLTGSSTS